MVEPEAVGGCPYNNGIDCGQYCPCYKCGWNPEVQKERVAKIKEKFRK